MKKSLAALVVALPLMSFASEYDIKSRTFFTAIPQFQAGTPEREALFRDHFVMNDTKRLVFEAVAYGGKSHNSNRLAQYFLPFGKCELLVAEDGASDVASRDVDAVHLNIAHDAPGNTFQSKVKFIFEQDVFGIGLAARARIFKEKDSKWWVAASAPIEVVRNKAKLCETIEDAGGTLESALVPRVANVTQAFKQTIWEFGRIDGEHHSRTRIADIELQVGYQWKTTGKSHGESYIGLVIPTGNKPEGKLVFEPIVGNNQHFGIMTGSMLAEEFYNDGIDSFYFIITGNSQYLFENSQVRSFDLTDKQWGRYMEVYVNKDAAQAAFNASTPATGDIGSPGINVFTRCLRVTPRFLHRYNLALLYKHKPWHLEGGYNLTSRQAEKVRLEKCLSGPALVAKGGSGQTTKARTINHGANAVDDFPLSQYAILAREDLDITSAAHPALISSVLYLSLGYQKNSKDSWSPMLGIGGSYEFSGDNTTLDRWTAWFKAGVVY
jgi:hypothetical protein